MGDLSENFSRWEFQCQCKRQECDAVGMDSEFIYMLQKLRTEFGHPLRIVSGSRCMFHNRRIGGVVKSWHLRGRACDIAVKGGLMRFILAKKAFELGFRGIGIGHNFIHLDNRDTWTALWSY
jgi:uncharacterized protein YcbK (DUF882 family)